MLDYQISDNQISIFLLPHWDSMINKITVISLFGLHLTKVQLLLATSLFIEVGVLNY